MSIHRNLMTACFAAVFALGLAACSSSSDDDTPPDMTMTPDPMPEPDPKPVATVMVPDAMYLDADNMPMAGEMEIAPGMSYTSGGVNFSCPADGDPCELSIAADGSVTSTGGEATAMLTENAMTQVAATKLMYRDRIIGKDRAIEAAANIGTAGPTEANIGISRAPGKAAAVRVTAPAGYSVSDDPALPNGDVWIGTHLTRTAGGNTDHLFVYTDIEAPTRIQFYNWDGDATTPSLYADTAVTDDSGFTQPADATTVITPLSLGDGGATFSAATADPTKFPQPQLAEEGSLRQAYPNNDASTPGGANDRVSIPGNYNGAGGRYICSPPDATTTCAVTVAPAGTYTLVGTWTFVPELGSTAWLQDGGTAAGAGGGQIGDFMSFGWWLREPTASTGAYTFEYYADGSAYSLASGSNVAAGSATYNGRAAGKYVMQEIDDTGVTGGNAGMFTAAASLTARFNGTGAGGTLQGTINGFHTDNMGVDVSGWSVTLARQTLTDTSGTSVTSAGTNNDPTASSFDGATAMMGDQTAHGTWVSQFFGQPTTADAYPLGVGGTFQADNESASIGGAFGARR